MGFNDAVAKWIKEFLTDRFMSVKVKRSFSCWTKVQSGVPQGSVLGPLLFLLFVNELPKWVVSSMLMFADDTKIWQRITNQVDSDMLQDDLDKLVEWSRYWLLKFNSEKCKVMHINHCFETSYKIGGEEEGKEQVLEVVKEEKDLGIWISDDLNSDRQCCNAVARTDTILRMVKRSFPHLDKSSFRLLYKSYIRPHLEYCIQVWSPNLQRNIDILERVQRRATKLVVGFRNKTYVERLQLLGFTTLQKRRERGDLIETYKILSGLERVDSSQFFTLASTGYDLRGHSKKLLVNRCRVKIRQGFFSQRVVAAWNDLPASVVEAPSVNCFKSRLDTWWKSQEERQIWVK